MSSVLDDIDTATWCLLCDLIAGTANISTGWPRTAADTVAAVMEALWTRQPIRHTTDPGHRHVPERFIALKCADPDLGTGRVAAAWCVARLAVYARHLPHSGVGCRHHQLAEVATTARHILASDEGSWLYTTSLAARYDRDRPFATPEFTAAITIIARSRLSGRDTIEFGAGTGAITRIAAPHTRSLIAIEPAIGMRAVLQQHTSNFDHVQVRSEDCMSVDLPDACADVVYEHAALCFVDEPLFAVAEAARLLRPGGAFVRIISTTEPPEPITVFNAAFHAQLRLLGHGPGRIVSSGNDLRITDWLSAAGITTQIDTIATWTSQQPLHRLIAPLLNGSYPYLAAIPSDERRRAIDGALTATRLDRDSLIRSAHAVKTASSRLDSAAIRMAGASR
ncbi:class I SAM-dependent methyltransferase [Nocardia abscessus]|uniref:Class I SAM-dependent methyltransferase n=1 Tax=Nocardia abscessus TaxID=120957 RepID=A0ABS0CA89_9NOCA|nr:class I SAM-dependent methyltransferase [Nocardia abscessus]MBF6227121.1 class I SAM-dependent methyltransferase [Nocardia abscessus]